MLVFLSRYEPSDVVCSQDGVEHEPSDEDNGEDKEPVYALNWDAGEGSEAVFICHIFLGASFKPWKQKQKGVSAIIDWHVFSFVAYKMCYI